MSASGRYIDSFEQDAGAHVGSVDSYFLLDLGYDFGGGLRAHVKISNLLDHEHRQLLGVPKTGRVASARMIYKKGFRSRD